MSSRSPSSIGVQSEGGLVTKIGGLIGLAAQTPIGAAIDETRAKRGYRSGAGHIGDHGHNHPRGAQHIWGMVSMTRGEKLAS